MKKLSPKQAKFVASYQIEPNAHKAAINAGYSEKSAYQIGWQLLKKPLIIKELDEWKAKKAEEFSKKDCINMAMGDYRNLDLTEPNKPRFFELASKMMGYIGSENGNVTNNTQINIDAKILELGSDAKWDQIRKLLG